jgi:outer membrane protein OmpA-like peptidoglycan-associated protein
MKTPYFTSGRTALAAAVAAALVLGCASAPMKPAGSEQVREKLSSLQRDPELASHAAIAIKDAEIAVSQAEIAQPDLDLAAHRVYIADRKVDSARALAETRFTEEQRPALLRQRDQARLDARTREADVAQANMRMARVDTEAAQQAADSSRRESLELQQQLDELKAQPTDRGLVLTLGDTLFATGRSELRGGATADLDRLGTFLTEYPERTASIEGFTDSRGAEEYNQALSQRRADAVKQYLVGRGIDSTRLSSAGRGENAPVADNESPGGRQQNRRVEVVINQP